MGRVTFNASGLGPIVAKLDAAEEIARAPMAFLGDRFIEITRDFIEEEAEGSFFFNPGGGRSPHPRTEAFGDRPAPSKRLGGKQGRHYRAWLGGPGGSTRKTARTFSLINTVPGIEMHRGGTGARPSPRLITRIKAKRTSRNGTDSAMRMLFGTFGVWVSDDKLRGEGVGIRSSAHAARHPRQTAAMIEAAEQAFAEL